MGAGGANKPGSLERRYSALSDDRKNLYYALRRHLYYTPEEVDDLPIWQIQMYAEKLKVEFKNPDDDDEVDGFTDFDSTNSGVQKTDDISSLGFHIHTS